MSAKNKKTVNVTEKELAQILLNTVLTKGSPVFASILQMTQPKCVKKSRVTGEPNPYASVNKISRVGIIVNGEYETAVVNQLAREGADAENYEKGKNTMPLVFGENNRVIGMYNGEYVIQYRPNDNVKAQSVYFADGKRTDKEKLAQYLPVERAATNQGTEREIFWRKVYLSNVLRLSFMGKVYNVIG